MGADIWIKIRDGKPNTRRTLMVHGSGLMVHGS